eukprot:753042-Alexandrium_andersonii.AAC.1
MNEFGEKRYITVSGQKLQSCMNPVIQVLGTKIRADANEDDELNFKMERGWKCFWRLKKLFLDKK